MKLGQDYFPKSSFLSVEKDLRLIVNQLLTNERLTKLLYYTDKKCLSNPDLSAKEKLSLIDNHIRIVPQILIDKDCPIYIIITMDNFTPNATNPEFRDCTVNFDILCHPDHWSLGDFQLRPYKIAGEIDSMLNKKKLTGIGEMNLITGTNLVINDQLMGLTLIYSAIHGVEDQI